MRSTTPAMGSRMLAIALTCAFAAPAAASESLAGLSLEHAIAALEQRGLRIFYSSDLVRPWMEVGDVPEETAAPADALVAILAPHGLTTRPGPQDSMLVVRDRDTRLPAPVPSAAKAAGSRAAAPGGALLEEVVVAASRYELRRPVSASRMHFGSRDLEYLPDLGEDAVRAVARLPGTASNGFSARPHIRGGARDETLVRLDGLKLYDPFHLKDFQGVFSMIDPRIVGSMDVYTGGFPARFGHRMSGIVDIETIAPPEPLYHELGVSFFNLSLLSAGRFDDARGDWLVSARRSNLDLLYEQFSEQPERPRYEDAFAKLAYRFGDAWTLTGHVLRAEDDITLADDLDREEAADAHHSDRYAWLSLEYAPNEAVSGTATLAHAALDSRRAGATAKEGISTGMLTDVRAFTIETLAGDWRMRLGESLLLEAGGSVEWLAGRYAYADDVGFDVLFDVAGAPAEPSRMRSIELEPSGRALSLYASLRYRIHDRAAVEVGLRGEEHTLAPAAGTTLDPRLGFRFRLTERMDLRASWGRFRQGQAIDELAVGDGETAFSGPQRAEHLVLGFDRDFDAGLRLRVDLYEKRMSRLHARFENLLNSQVLLPELKPDRIRLTPDGATARGVELMLDSAPGPVQWWLGYSLSRVRDRIGEERILRAWDQTHALTVGVVWDTPRWNASAGVMYRSGWPTTRVALDAADGTPTVTAPLGRNTERLGAYRTLDLRVTRKIDLPRSSLAVSFELANAFGRNNPCCAEYEIGVDPAEAAELGTLVLDPLEYLPTIPSLGVLWKF